MVSAKVPRAAWAALVILIVPVLTLWLYYHNPTDGRFGMSSRPSEDEPQASPAKVTTSAPSATPTIPPKKGKGKPKVFAPPLTPDIELLPEQIWSDFPGNYTNQNDWFEEPKIHSLYENMVQLTEEEKEELLKPRILAAARNTRQREDKIRRLYNVNGANKGWRDHIDRLDDEGLAPLTKWAQDYIYHHQHPDSCKGKQFYVLDNRWPRHGLGAIVRRVMVEMTQAMIADRILVFSTSKAPGDTLLDPNCDPRGPDAGSLQCILDDITSCASYVTEDNSISKLKPEMFRNGIVRDFPAFVEATVQTVMSDTGLRPTGTYLRYWWRSQMYGYIMRPRPETLARMYEIRMNRTLHKGVALSRGDEEVQTTFVNVPFPLPPSTISIHIRHGDKGGEGRLISTRDYIVAAERFIHRNPLSYLKRAFVSTEDPLVIPELLSTPFINNSTSFPNADWSWYYSNIPRVNSGPQANLWVNPNKTEALLTHMTQLWMALECDTFVGIRNSNWNKMIDALRCTLLDKCNLPYLEAGFVTDWEYFP